jgi:hypothetical protein
MYTSWAAIEAVCAALLQECPTPPPAELGLKASCRDVSSTCSCVANSRISEFEFYEPSHAVGLCRRVTRTIETLPGSAKRRLEQAPVLISNSYRTGSGIAEE